MRRYVRKCAKIPSVFVMGVGIAERGGSYKVTAGLLEEFGEKRVIDTPIAEASFTGLGCGSRHHRDAAGCRDIICRLYTLLTMDQLFNQAAKYKFMTGETRSVPLVRSEPRAVSATALPPSIPKALKRSFTTYPA